MRRRGVATVEFGLIFPILAVILLISAHFGRILYTTVVIGNAARAGAQYGAQSTALVRDTEGIRLAATAEAFNIGAVAVTSQFSCRCDTGATVNCVTGNCGSYGPPALFLQVTASKNVSYALPLPGPAGTLAIVRTATLRVQ